MPKKTTTLSKSLVDAPVQQVLIQMTMPVIIGMLMMFSFNLVDVWFIGRLGTEALAAITFTFPVTFTVMSLSIGLGIGTSAVVAKYLGKGELENAKQASTVATYVSLSIAAIVAILSYFLMNPLFLQMGASSELLSPINDYMLVWLPGSLLLVGMMTGNSILRANGDTKTPSMLMIIAGLINAILDPLFIFGIGPFPEMGIQGAAVATLISWVIAFVFLFYILIIKLDLVSRHLPSSKVMKSSSREMLRIGAPAAGANMMTPFAAIIMTSIVASYGDAAVAAFGVGSRLEPIATLIVLAMSTSLPPLVSQNFGAGRMDRVVQAYKLSVRFLMVWQLIVYLGLVLAASSIASFFSDDAQVIEIIKLIIFILPLGYGLQGLIILTNSTLNALHQPAVALYLSAARFAVFYVPLAYVGSLLYGLEGFFGGALLGNLIMAAISWHYFNKTVSQEQRLMAETAISA